MSHLWPGRDGPGIRYITAQPPVSWQSKARRHLVLLGSTGSIGRNALSVVEANAGEFVVEGLACATNVERLLEQALAHRPRLLAVLDEASKGRLESMLPADYAPEILVGPKGYRKLASIKEADTVVSAQVGAAGLAGTLAAALAGKVICLANKESLVLAGDLLRHVCSVTGASILPVDSEHFALFDCLAGRGEDVDHLVLTASGGPFRGRSREELEDVSPAMALRHPNWNMGAKITIDSATLMNKALEFIEACQLYGADPTKVKVLVHPQSIVHSLVAFKDGGLLAQLAVPDMRLPIGACLRWPRVDRPLVEPLDLVSAGALSFENVREDAFPSIALAKQAMRIRCGMSVVLNGANEEAVSLFLKGKCSFLDITGSVASAMEAHLDAIRLDGDFTSAVPLSLSGRIRTLVGDDLNKAAWSRLEEIRVLGERARAFVRAYVEEGGHK